jgi:hypothetical protein
MYYTGIDPFSKQEVYVARNLRDRKLQRSLLQFFKPDNYIEVRNGLEQASLLSQRSVRRHSSPA